MDMPAIVNHALNFIAPALFVALLLALLGPAARAAQPSAPEGCRRWGARCWRAFWVTASIGVATLALSLALSGHDAEIAGYAALVVTSASSQWVLTRGWRR